MGITVRLDVVIEVQKFPETSPDLWTEVMEIPGGQFCVSSDQAHKFRSSNFFNADLFEESNIPSNSVKVEKLNKEFNEINGFCLTLEEMEKIDWNEKVKKEGKWKKHSENIRKALSFYEEKEGQTEEYSPKDEELEDLKDERVLEKENSCIIAERKTRNDFKPDMWPLAETFMQNTIQFINGRQSKEENKIGKENIRILFMFPSGKRKKQKEQN